MVHDCASYDSYVGGIASEYCGTMWDCIVHRPIVFPLIAIIVLRTDFICPLEQTVRAGCCASTAASGPCDSENSFTCSRSSSARGADTGSLTTIAGLHHFEHGLVRCDCGTPPYGSVWASPFVIVYVVEQTSLCLRTEQRRRVSSFSLLHSLSHHRFAT